MVQHDAASQQTSLEMDFGKVRSKVVKITQPNGKFEIKTPNAVIGVVGTDFYVGYDADRTTVICYRGKVMVTPSANAKIMRNSGQADGNNSIAVSEGQMVIISTEIPAGGFPVQPGATGCVAGDYDGHECSRWAVAVGPPAPGAQPDHRDRSCRDRMGCGIHAAEFERRRRRAASAELPDESESETVRMICGLSQ